MCVALNTVPGLPGLPGAASNAGPAEPARRPGGRRPRRPRARPQRPTGALERRGARRADHGPAAGGLRPVAGQPAGARRWSVRQGGEPSDHPPHQDPADDLRGHHAARRAPSSARATPSSTRRSTTTTTRSTAHFADSGGIFAGGEVTYRGVSVGKVNKLVLTDEGVDVVLDIDNGYDEIPADTLAVVGNRSAVGEQYVELQPQRDDGPYLHNGSVIDEQDTRLPIATDTLLTHLSETVRVGRQGRPEDHRRRARRGVRRHRRGPPDDHRHRQLVHQRPPTTTSTSPRR